MIALGGSLAALTDNMGLIGPEVPDARALNIPLDQAEIVVTNIGARSGAHSRSSPLSTIAGQVQI